MADPRALEDTWRRTIKKFPSLGDRWGDTLPLNPNGTPVVGAMQEAIDLYRAQKKARMAAPPTPVPPTAVPPTSVPPTAALPTAAPPTAAPPTAEPDSNWLSRNIRGALGVGQNILGAVTTPFEEFHQRVVIPSVSAKTKFMPLKWDPKEERSLLQNLTQAPQVTFDAFMKPGGGLDPGAFADFLQQFAAPPAQTMLSPAPIIREALNVPTESQGTVRAQRIEEEAQRREAETGVPLSQQERRQIGEGLYPLPPYVRGLTEELPYFAVPPARGVRTAMQAKRAALEASPRFGRATPAVTKTIRAGEMGLKPIEIIEEMPRAVIGATARGIGRAGRLMGKTPGREAPLPPTGEAPPPPTPEKVPTPEVSSQAVGLTPDEVTQLGRLKTQLARDEAALGGILSDVEDVADVPTTTPTARAAAEPLRGITKHPIDMTPEEFDDILKRQKDYEDNIEVAILGPERASEWKKAQTVANSRSASRERQEVADEIIGRIENQLTEPERNAIFGIRDPNTSWPQSYEELRGFRSAVHIGKSSDDSTDFLMGVVGRELYRVKDPSLALEAIRGNKKYVPSSGRSIYGGRTAQFVPIDEQEAAIKTQNAIRELQRRGVPADDIFSQAYRRLSSEVSEEGAEYLLRDWIDLVNRGGFRALPSPAARTAAVPEATLDANVGRARLKEIRAEVDDIVRNATDEGGLTASEGDRYQQLIQEDSSIRFYIRRPLNVNKVKPAAERLSILSTEEVSVAHKALYSDKNIYMAMSESAAGTWNASPTVIDDIVSGTNQNVSLKQFYGTFAPVRDILRQKHGDTIHLYRATGEQIDKPTTNWASTHEGASQYGTNIIEQDVPIDDILALNVGSNGNYEEFIVSSITPQQAGATPIVKDLRASIQRGQDEISALEARSGVMDVPTADAGDIPTPGVTGEKWDLYTGEALRTASNELDRIIGNVPSTTTVKKPGITRAARDVKRVVYELLTEEDMSPTDRKNKIKYISEHTKPETPESLTELIDRARKEPKVGQEDFISEGTVETLEKSHVSRDLGRRLVERAYHVLRLPDRMKTALLSGLFTPASIMGLPGKKSVKEAVLYRILEEKHTARINYKLSWFMDNLPAVEKIAREGVDGTPFGDIAENPGRYLREGKIDQEAYEWITNAHKIIDDAADNYQYVTGKVLKVDLEREHYWPRFTKDGIDDYNKQGRLFKKVGPQKKRFHEYMKDGVEAGVDYEDAPMAQLQLYLGSVGKITRDAIFEQRLLSQEIAFKSAGKGEGKARVKAEWEGRPKGWGTLYFDEKDSRQIGIILGKKNKLLNLADVTSQVPKTIVAGTFDTGQFMLQSIGLLALSPERWGKAVYASIRTIFEPGYYHRYLNDIIPNETRAAANSGVDIGAVSEFYGSSGPSAKPPAERVARKVPVIGSPLGGLISRMQGGFGAHIGVAKILMFDSMADVAIRTMPNPELRQQELLRIGRIVDSMLGGTSTKGLGVPATQRQVESAILFFAARYTRAVWATFGHALGSGVGADETRRILARMMWGGMLVISGLNGLMGTFEGKTRKEINKQILDSLNPTEGKKFMSVKVGSGYFGIGGGYRSALGFLTKTFTLGEWEEAELRDNPLYNYARSKMPITTATLADALEGEDFVGREFTYEAFTEDPSLILESLKDRLAPFPVQSFLEASSSGLPVQIGTGAAEFVGLRTVPGSTTEKQSEMIREWAKGLGPGSSYGDLAKFTGIEFPTTGPLAVSSEELAESPTDYWQFGKVARREMGKDPEYAALEERWEKDRKRWNRRSAEFYEEEERKEEEVYGSGGLLERLGEKSMEVDYEHPGEMYRIGKKKVLNDYYVLKDDRRLEAEKEGIFSEHEREGPIRQAEDRYNKLLYADDGSNEYIKEVERLTGRAYVPIDDPITGDVNWDEKDRRKDFLRNTYGQGFIDSMNYSDQELPEFERQYRRDFDYLDKQGYWNVEESLAKQAGLESELEEYKEAQRTDRVRARAIEKEPSDFNNMVLKKVTEGRRQLRIADPEIERIILYYYERKPASETGPRSLFERIRERAEEEEVWLMSIRQ